jgi:hypothetical protein
MKMYIDDLIERLESRREDTIAEVITDGEMYEIMNTCANRYDRVNTPE